MESTVSGDRRGMLVARDWRWWKGSRSGMMVVGDGMGYMGLGGAVFLINDEDDGGCR